MWCGRVIHCDDSGKMTIVCGKTNLTEEDFQQTGADPRTVVGKTPEYDVIMQWARDTLEF